MTLTIEEEFSATLMVFTARNVPLGPGDFAIFPAPHISLTLAINNHPLANTYVRAEAGLTWSGLQAVVIEALQPVEPTNLLSLLSSSAAMRITGVEPSQSGAGLLTGGAKITQSSLLAGGDVTIHNGLHDSELGMVCEGGAVLPPGTMTAGIIYAPSP
jgi:hypothetical protein